VDGALIEHNRSSSSRSSIMARTIEEGIGKIRQARYKTTK